MFWSLDKENYSCYVLSQTGLQYKPLNMNLFVNIGDAYCYALQSDKLDYPLTVRFSQIIEDIRRKGLS